MSDFLFTPGELTCGRDINLPWINIDKLKARTSVTNKELPGQYFRRVELNVSCQKLGYILPIFYRPSKGGHRPHQGGILRKESLREAPRMFLPLYTAVSLPIYVPTTSLKLMALWNIKVEALLSNGASGTVKQTSHPV